MLRIFTPVKIQRLRPGLNQRTWVPEASRLTTRSPKPSDAGNVQKIVSKQNSFYFLLSILPFFIAFSRIPILRSARILSMVGLHLFQFATAKRPEN